MPIVLKVYSGSFKDTPLFFFSFLSFIYSLLFFCSTVFLPVTFFLCNNVIFPWIYSSTWFATEDLWVSSRPLLSLPVFSSGAFLLVPSLTSLAGSFLFSSAAFCAVFFILLHPLLLSSGCFLFFEPSLGLWSVRLKCFFFLLNTY